MRHKGEQKGVWLAAASTSKTFFYNLFIYNHTQNCHRPKYYTSLGILLLLAR